MNFLKPFFGWLEQYKIVAFIAGIGSFFAIMKLRDNRLEKYHRTNEREKFISKHKVEQAKAEAKLDATVSNIINEEKESHHEAVEARDTAIAPNTADELPDEIRNRFIRD